MGYFSKSSNDRYVPKARIARADINGCYPKGFAINPIFYGAGQVDLKRLLDEKVRISS